MRMRIYVKDDHIKDIELDLDIVESLVIKYALELFVSDEDFEAIHRTVAADMLKTMAEDRELIDIDDLS